MNKEQALKMAKAKLECIERQTSGKTELCKDDCESCSLCYEQGNMGEQKEWLKMAIKALENQCPSKGVDCEDCPANEPCEDAISRQEVLSCYQAMRDMGDLGKVKYVVLVDNIKMLPPIHPKAKSGKWITNGTQDSMIGEEYKCSICNEVFILDHNFNYCPNCGSKMESEVEE